MDKVHSNFFDLEQWIVYILQCNDSTYYTGCTNNFDERFLRHQKGYVNYTKTRLPLKIACKVIFYDKHKAYAFEKYLKSGSGIAFRNKRLL
ncbi:MAG: GIY-YIG nuclease family protein [Flavobacteriaceae bacterium]|nr:GIY-YIG nuclease family protein [Flavobacteriaceae bacterium]